MLFAFVSCSNFSLCDKAKLERELLVGVAMQV